jgi:hypothetical protein
MEGPATHCHAKYTPKRHPLVPVGMPPSDIRWPFSGQPWLTQEPGRGPVPSALPPSHPTRDPGLSTALLFPTQYLGTCHHSQRHTSPTSYSHPFTPKLSSSPLHPALSCASAVGIWLDCARFGGASSGRNGLICRLTGRWPWWVPGGTIYHPPSAAATTTSTIRPLSLSSRYH